MTRHEIAQHPATEVNPPWTLSHHSDSAGAVDEYQLICGVGWLVLDPRDPDDRAQMVEIGNALLAAANGDTGATWARLTAEIESLAADQRAWPQTCLTYMDGLSGALRKVAAIRAEAGK